jgi:membrane-anchored mycosin MYCP
MSAPHARPGADLSRAQIVVSTKHADLVIGELSALGAIVTPEVSEALGLTLLDFDVAGPAKAARGRADALPAMSRPGGEPRTDLDAVMRHLRATFAAQYAGWMPAMGKNREVSRVPGSYVVAQHAVDYGADVTTEHAVDYGADVRPEHAVDYGVDVSAGHAVDYGAGITGDHAVDYGADGPTAVALPRTGMPARAAGPGAGRQVGIIDTAIASHPYLVGATLARAEDLVDPGDPTRWQNHHGTFVSGLVLAQAPGSVIHFRASLDPEAKADSWDVAKALAELASIPGLDIINLSLGCVTEDGEPPLVFVAAVERLGPDTLVIAAAGNHATPGQTPKPSWPAALDTVVAVGAIGAQGDAPFSPDAPWVDAVAPGVGVVSTAVAGNGRPGFARWSGTSFSAASVSGMVAAAMRPGMTARAAYEALVADAERDDSGRAILRPDAATGWPR